MGEAIRRGNYEARRAQPKGDAWRRTIRPTMVGARVPMFSTRLYRTGERVTYSDGIVMVADHNGSLRRVSERRFET